MQLNQKKTALSLKQRKGLLRLLGDVIIRQIPHTMYNQ